MELSGSIFTIEAGYREVHIFWNHYHKEPLSFGAGATWGLRGLSAYTAHASLVLYTLLQA